MMSMSAKSCQSTGLLKVLAGGGVVGGGVVGGGVVGGGVVGPPVGAGVVGPTDPVQAVPLRVNAVGTGLLPLHAPLNPNDTVASVAMVPL
jgi:hypothetical protein